MGRRTICTPELTERICEVLRNGNYVQTACEFVGISESAYHKWVSRGEAELARMEAEGLDEPDPAKEPYVRFVEQTTHARSAARVKAITTIRQAADKDWKAEAWYLEHGHRDLWGKRRQEVDITTNGEKVEFRIAFPGENDADD